MATTMDETTLYQLMTWLSPAYPIGAFCHSSGLEWAVEAGWVHDQASTEAWIENQISHGAGKNDAVLFAYAHRATAAKDCDGLQEVVMLAAAAHPSAERQSESLAQGAAFRRIALDSGCWAHTQLKAIDGRIAYSVAVAVLAAEQGISLAPALTAYLHGLTGNLVSAAQRLVPLGQTDAQITIANLQLPVAVRVEAALALSEPDAFRALGGCTLLADMASMRHETQYTRLFRT